MPSPSSLTRTRVTHRVQAGTLFCLGSVLERLGPVQASGLGGRIARTIGPWLPVSRLGDANLRRGGRRRGAGAGRWAASCWG